MCTTAGSWHRHWGLSGGQDGATGKLTRSLLARGKMCTNWLLRGGAVQKWSTTIGTCWGVTAISQFSNTLAFVLTCCVAEETHDKVHCSHTILESLYRQFALCMYLSGISLVVWNTNCCNGLLIQIWHWVLGNTGRILKRTSRLQGQIPRTRFLLYVIPWSLSNVRKCSYP